MEPSKRKKHAVYLRTVWYPKNRAKMVACVLKWRNAKVAYIQGIKKESGCGDCGLKDPKHPEVFDFDHRRDKSFNLSSAARQGYGLETIKKEIAKCDVVCANCHRIRTKKRLKRRMRA